MIVISIFILIVLDNDSILYLVFYYYKPNYGKLVCRERQSMHLIIIWLSLWDSLWHMVSSWLRKRNGWTYTERALSLPPRLSSPLGITNCLRQRNSQYSWQDNRSSLTEEQMPKGFPTLYFTLQASEVFSSERLFDPTVPFPQFLL